MCVACAELASQCKTAKWCQAMQMQEVILLQNLKEHNNFQVAYIFVLFSIK